ncbi:MAG: DUF7557 family protein [Nanoarchaeota archaeon]
MSNKKITTIKLESETKKRLEKLKENKRETYEDIIKKMLWILNTLKLDPPKARETLEKIDETRKRIGEKDL